MEDRKKTLLYTVIILAAGLCYYVFITVTGISIPCVFHLVTGLKCPGCGITSMFKYMLNGNFSAAFHSNQCVFILLPIWLCCLIIRFIFLPKCLSQSGKLTKIVTISSVVILLAFGVVRNIF